MKSVHFTLTPPNKIQSKIFIWSDIIGKQTSLVCDFINSSATQKPKKFVRKH